MCEEAGLFLMISFELFFFCLFVLSSSIVLVFVLFYPLEAFVCYNERQKGE